MIAFICFFFPAVISLWLFESLVRCRLDRKQWFYRFCANTLLINFICFGIKRFFLQTADAPLYSLGTDMYPSAAFNYILMAVLSAVILVIFEVLLSKKIKIELKDENHEEETN